MTSIHLNLGEQSYEITVGSGLLNSAEKYFNLNRRVFIITDSGVPGEYAEAIAKRSKSATIYTVSMGEESKSLSTMERVLSEMLSFGMTRKDAVVAVGGGVVGDLSGFCASAYMRGIDFYNVPTTILAQVDSSIGGKCAVNLGNTKNVVGAFYQPRAVLIDTDTLRTLPKRHYNAGLAESVKMALCSDSELFEIFEKNAPSEYNIEEIIIKSLLIKKSVVEKDEKESGLRKILNFGHTFGHGIEAESGLGGLYHGECVALGMIPVCSKATRKRLTDVLLKLDLPTVFNGDIDKALSFVKHDKKTSDGGVDAIFVDEPGSFRIERMDIGDFSSLIKKELVEVLS